MPVVRSGLKIFEGIGFGINLGAFWVGLGARQWQPTGEGRLGIGMWGCLLNPFPLREYVERFVGLVPRWSSEGQGLAKTLAGCHSCSQHNSWVVLLVANDSQLSEILQKMLKHMSRNTRVSGSAQASTNHDVELVLCHPHMCDVSGFAKWFC